MKNLHAAILILEVFGVCVGYLPPAMPMTVVTSISDSGPGSLRDAVENGERCVVFDVSGTIRLRTTLILNRPIEVLGGTSPGGITLACDRDMRGPAVEVCGNKVYLGHLRIRPGAGLPSQKSRDAVLLHDCEDPTLDHLSISWATDECIDCWKNVRRLTVRDCIISEGLAFHRNDYPETGHSCGCRVGPDSEAHFARVLFAHNNSRSPLITQRSRVTLSNVIVVNPGSQAIATGASEGGPVHLAASGCVVISGINTPKRLKPFEIVGDARVLTRDCWHIVGDKATSTNIATPNPPDVATIGHRHGNAFGVVAVTIKDIGARPWSRDATDRRILEEVRTGKGGRIKHESEREGSGVSWDAVDEPENVKR